MTNQIQIPDTFKWIIGLLLTVIAFFLGGTFMTVDKINQLIIG